MAQGSCCLGQACKSVFPQPKASPANQHLDADPPILKRVFTVWDTHMWLWFHDPFQIISVQSPLSSKPISIFHKQTSYPTKGNLANESDLMFSTPANVLIIVEITQLQEESIPVQKRALLCLNN